MEIQTGFLCDDFRYMKFIYLHCGEETKLRDHHSCVSVGAYSRKYGDLV